MKTMRLSTFSGAVLSLVIGAVMIVPAVHAQMGSSSSAAMGPSPYPFFRRTVTSSSSSISSSSSLAPRLVPHSPQGDVGSSTSSSVVGSSSSSALSSYAGSNSSLSNAPTVGVFLESDRSEAYPGESVRYWIKTRNLYVRDLPQWNIAFFFDRSQMQILETGGGRLQGDHVMFTVPATHSNEEQNVTVLVHLYKNLKAGTTVTTYGSMIADGTISAACSKNALTIASPVRLLQTGAGDGTSPVENLRAFLRPVSATSQGSPMPLMVWGSVALSGLALGGRLGKKFI